LNIKKTGGGKKDDRIINAE